MYSTAQIDFVTAKVGLMTSYKDKCERSVAPILKSNCCSVGYDCFYRLYDKKSQWDDIRGELHEPEFELSG